MKRTTETVIRTILLALALLNQLLSATGRGPLPIADDEVETLVSTGLTVAAALWSWWKNNSVTIEAQLADDYLDALRARSQSWAAAQTQAALSGDDCYGISAEEAQQGGPDGV